MSDPGKDVAVVLLELTQRLSDGRSLEESLAAVTDAAVALLPCDHASIRLLDASRTQLLAGARAGKGTERGSLTLKKGEGIAGWVFEYGIAARVDDAREDARFMVAVGQGFRIGSMIGEPLVSAGKVIGVLSVSSPEVRAFSDRDVLLAKLLANCCVPPIERARLERLAVTDDLTLAFTQRYLRPRLQEEIDRAKSSATSLSLLAIDLDRFKHVNASYGNSVGDRVLALFADQVRALTRRFDVLVRTGGDDFALILPASNEAEAEAFAARLAKHVAESPMEPMPGAFITQTVSIGVATYNGRESAEDLEDRARGGLDQAKRAKAAPAG
jgi:diguanylate cyclase (GGDEF)-like protein